MLRYNRQSVPDQPTGAPLDVRLEIIAPETTTNLFTNPSWETNTSNWTNSNDGSGGTPYTRATTHQFKGAYAAVLTIRTGGTYGQIVGPTISNATLYSMQFHVRRSNGGLIRSATVKVFVNGAVTDFDAITYISNGWYRVEKTWLSTSTSAVGLRVVGTPGQVFYVDAAQLEAKGYCTTYADGDQPGLLPIESPPAYYWTGTPHASTSVRSATTRAGGRPMSVARYGLTILALIGFGFSQRSVIATPLGLADGSLYQRTIRESRTFTLAGVFDAADPRTLSARRGALRAALAHDLSGLDQPVTLRLQRYDRGDPMGDQVTLAASYLEGLGEDMTQPFDEKVSVQFEAFLPALVSAGSRGTTVVGNTTVANANRVIGRNAAGQWFALSTGLNNTVSDIIRMPDGRILLAGQFTNALAIYNPADGALTSHTVGTVNQAITVIYDSVGNLYLGGLFSSAYSVAANNIARYDGASWSALGVGTNNYIRALAIGPDGNLIAGGAFTTAGGSGANRIARWDGAAWSALGSGVNNEVFSIVTGPDGYVYVGGTFTQAGGNPANRVARWTGSAWEALGTGMDSDVYRLTFDSAGNLYAVGNFTTAGGLTANGAAKWNGVSWAPLGTGITGGYGGAVQYDTLAGRLLVGGTFTSAGGVTTPDSIATWTGSAWLPSDVNLPGTAVISALRALPDGSLYIGFNTGGNATVPVVNTIDNPGTMPTPMTVTITAPAASSTRLYSITNYTTGATIAMNVTLFAGEQATLQYNGGALRLTSNFRGTIPGILVGSDAEALLLIPGNNSIAAFADSSSTVLDVSFTPQYESLDDATRTPALR